MLKLRITVQVSAKLCHQYVVIVELKINYWMTIMSTFTICTHISPKFIHYVNYAMEMAVLQRLGESNSLRREGCKRFNSTAV